MVINQQVYFVGSINIHHFLCVNVKLLCFNLVPSNFNRDLVLIWLHGSKLLLDAAGALILSSENLLDFHFETLLLLAVYLKKSWNWLKH